MLIFYLILVCGASGALGNNLEMYEYSAYIPRYMEAYQNFAQAKDYIQKHLPRYVNERYISYVRDEDIAFGSLVAIAGGLVQEYTLNPKYYDPVDLLEEYEKYGKRYYLRVASATYDLLDEASEKISPIVDLMESICTRPPYLDCNEAVDAKVRSNPYAYYAPARLFIYLGKISKNILRNRALFERLTNRHETVPYLYVHVNDPSVVTLIKRLSKAYLLLRRMGSFE